MKRIVNKLLTNSKTIYVAAGLGTLAALIGIAFQVFEVEPVTSAFFYGAAVVSYSLSFLSAERLQRQTTKNEFHQLKKQVQKLANNSSSFAGKLTDVERNLKNNLDSLKESLLREHKTQAFNHYVSLQEIRSSLLEDKRARDAD